MRWGIVPWNAVPNRPIEPAHDDDDNR